MNEPRAGPSKPHDAIFGVDSELESSFFFKSKSTKASSTSMRENLLKRNLQSPLVNRSAKKLKDDIFNDTLFISDEIERVMDENQTNNNQVEVKEVSNEKKNDSDDFLSISQMNAFVVNDPFANENDNDVINANPDLDEIKFTQFCDNSQFMNQIESAIAKLTQIQKSQPLKNISNMQKTPPIRKQDDIFDTTFNDALCNLFKSTQYKREVEESFDAVEKSICLIGNDDKNEFNLSLNQSLPTSSRRSKIEELLERTFKSPEVMKKVIKHAEDSVNLNKEKIDWDDESLFNTSKGSAIEKIVKSALTEDRNTILSDDKLENATLMIDDVVFHSHGNFFGLPDRVKDIIRVYRGINKLYDWQEECLKLPAIAARKNLVYALPTSGGKTLVAEILILREILCRKRNAMLILPYVAIVQEKVWSMSPFAVALDFLVEEYAAGKGNYPPRKRRRKNSVYICTIEKALGLINSLIETNRTEEIGLVVVDELHLLGDGSRGACLETLLTKIKMLKNKMQIVGMSATIGNIDEICQFLNAEVYSKDFRPVELVEYVKCQKEIACVNKHATDVDEVLSFQKRVNYYKNMENLEKLDPDHLGGLVMDVIPDASCLIFCKTRQNCENVATLLCKVFNPDLMKHRQTEKTQIKNALKEEVGSLCKILANTINFGVAYHHSGLTAEERRLIEDGFRQGTICVICCTSTLAAGVNLPAKRVIIRNPYVGREFINLSRYKQMIGRAGRAGYGEIGESIIICTPHELPRIKALFMSPMDVALSSMHDNNCDGLQNFLLSCVSLGLATTKRELQNLVGKTLMAVQADRLKVDVRNMTRQTIKHLFKWGALKTKNMDSQCDLEQSVSAKLESTLPESTCQSIEAMCAPGKKTKTIINIENNTPLEISKLGSAAMKGGLDLSRAHMLYEDLIKAQSSLVLFTGLHLMYLVTPYTISEQVKPAKSLYYSIYTKLDKREIQTAQVLGFNEAVACKFLTNRKVTEVSERVMNRFYVTLMLYDLWNQMSVYEVSLKYAVNRGLIQNLMTSAATFASNVYHFCGEFEEFWTFSLLLKGMSDRLSHCCVQELIPLMKLPAVKQNRAKQLFNAGYKTLQSVARANPDQLMEQIEFMSRKLANQLIAAAKMILLEKVENLREEAEDVLDGIQL